MNRLILIGNGFDLAHGLKTDYNSFMLWYLKNCFTRALNNEDYNDKLIAVKRRNVNERLENLPWPHNNVAGFIEYFFKKNFSILEDPQLRFDGVDITYTNPFIVKFKTPFFKELISKCGIKNWVDIENEFYDALKKCFHASNAPKVDKVIELNDSLKFIIEELESYLSILSPVKFIPDYSNILKSDIETKDILNCTLTENREPKFSMLLDFNYTPTTDEYYKGHNFNGSIELNHIHGKINDSKNPLVFGFGDELDDNYKRIEDSKVNEFFKYIKSFWYLKRSNYYNLVRFIESDEYQIFIWGHSCALSDRTLLNMLFEHRNCKSIKIYFHGDENENNHTHLTEEISRHFRDKVAMRSKIIPLDRSSAMPQSR